MMSNITDLQNAIYTGLDINITNAADGIQLGPTLHVTAAEQQAPNPAPPPPAPEPAVKFSTTQGGLKVAVWDHSTDVPKGTVGTIDWGDGAKVSKLPVGKYAGHNYSDDGTYTITVTFGEHEARHDVTLSDAQAPAPEPSGPADPPPDDDEPEDDEHLDCAFDATIDGLTLTLVDHSTSEGAPAATVQFDFGDGTTSKPVAPSSTLTHTYKHGGGFTIVGTLTDVHDHECTAQENVLATAPDDALPVDPDAGPSMPEPIGFIPKQVTAHVVFADKSTADVTAKPVERVAIRPGDVNSGSIKFYADGSVCVENSYMGTTADLPIHLTIKGDDAIIFDGDLLIWAGTRTHPYWMIEPKLLANPRLDLLPNIPPENVSRYHAVITADNGPMGASGIFPGMDAQGERDDLGQVGAKTACHIANPNAKNAKVVRLVSDAAAVCACHVVDPATNKMVDLSGNPWITMLDTYRGKSHKGNTNPIKRWISKNPLKMGTSASHIPNYNAVAAAVYGTDYDKEELAFWANFSGGLWQNPGYRLKEGCCSHRHGQTRGKGRRLNIVAYAANLSDNPAYFDRWMHAMCKNLALYTKQENVQIDQLRTVYGRSGYAPWQQHIFIEGMGRALDYGYTEAQAAFDRFGSWLADTLLNAPHEVATAYSIGAKHADGTWCVNWVDCLASSKKYAVAAKCKEGSQALQDALDRPQKPGDFIGYATSPTGYAAMMQPALAALYDHYSDHERAKKVWAKFQKWQRINYSTDPKYNHWPRGGV
jgi:hypothetical protein